MVTSLNIDMLSTLALHIEFDCSGASCFSKFSEISVYIFFTFESKNDENFWQWFHHLYHLAVCWNHIHDQEVC